MTHIAQDAIIYPKNQSLTKVVPATIRLKQANKKGIKGENPTAHKCTNPAAC